MVFLIQSDLAYPDILVTHENRPNIEASGYIDHFLVQIYSTSSPKIVRKARSPDIRSPGIWGLTVHPIGEFCYA